MIFHYKNPDHYQNCQELNATGNGQLARFSFYSVDTVILNLVCLSDMRSKNEKYCKNKPRTKRGVLSHARKEQDMRIIRSLAEELCLSEAMELVMAEYDHQKAGGIIRIYIDKEGGVTLEDCVVISRRLSDLLDIHLNTGQAYRLEVSSPGIERPLVKPSDFERFKGRRIKIKTKSHIEGQKTFTGILLGISEEIVSLQSRDKAFGIPHGEISRARLVSDVGDNE
jgi:ribosome maturation factor RimP